MACRMGSGALFLASALCAFGQFTFTSFDVPGSSGTYASAINNNGDIAGSYTTSFGTQAGFIRKTDGTFTTFDLSSVNATVNAITGINDLDAVVGQGVTAGGASFIFFVRDAAGEVTTLTGPSQAPHILEVVGLNNDGESIVQSAPSNAPELFFWLRSATNTFTSLPAPGGEIFWVPFTGLNSSGQAVGSWEEPPDNGQSDGFVLDLASGQFTLFDYSTGSNEGGFGHLTGAASINDSGTVLGSYFDGANLTLPGEPPVSGNFQTIEYLGTANGKLVESFAPPYPGGLNVTIPKGVNNASEITGYYLDAAGYHGFLGVPAPEKAAPVVSVISELPGPPEQVVFSVVDPVAGIVDILPIANNCVVQVDAFTPGQKTPVTVTATKTNQTYKAILGIQATNTAGNYIDFDPAFVNVYGPGGPPADSLSDVPPGENLLLVTNGNPGLSRLNIEINGRPLFLNLAPNEKRTLRLPRWMNSAGNTINFSGEGGQNTSASVVLADPSRAASSQLPKRF